MTGKRFATFLTLVLALAHLTQTVSGQAKDISDEFEDS